MECKSEGVRDVFKWLKKECKEKKKQLDKVKEEQAHGEYWCFDDNGQSIVLEAEVRLNTLVNVKISVEKYMKKLQYQEKEESENI